MLQFYHWSLFKVILSVQPPVWFPASAGEPQGSNLGPFFLIYKNDLSNSFSKTAELFGDVTSLSLLVSDINVSEFHVNGGF